MGGLNYAEARERAGLIDVLGYHVDLDLTRGDDVFGSVTVVRFGCRAPGAGSFIELRPACLSRVVLNGQEVDPGTLTGSRLPVTGLLAGNELRVEADMPYSRTGAGLHRFTDDADGETYLAVHAGLDHAQRVFAAFDQPDMKAVITATVKVPGSWTVTGNGRSRPAGEGRWTLAATPPISPYLFTLVAGPYHSIRAEHRGIPFGLHARRSLADQLDRNAEEIFAITRACFDRYREIFAEPYPFDSYDQAFVPELEAGAVENPGCVTFREEFLFPAAVTRAERQTRGIVIAHEMAHMWFGDLVTMRWWNDVWLSESFAEYMGFQVLSEATAFTGTWADCTLARKTRGYDADQRTSAHPVAPEPHEVPDTDAARSSYDDISYAKGAAALRQLVAWLGRPVFLAGINDYFARHRFGSAALDDLLDCLSRASGRDVRAWAGTWLRTAGVDTLAASCAGFGHAVIRHSGSRPHRVSVGVYDEGPGGGLALRARVPLVVTADASGVALRAPLAGDTRLRWQILLRLAVLGALGPAQLEREASADATATGRLNAARCRAAIPDEAAKRTAWTAMFDGAAEPGAPASGYQLAATAQGFWQADQAELLAGYVPRYFPALAEVAVRRGDDVARVLCQHGFPQHAVDAATLRAGRRCLERGDPIGSLRRLMADQLDDLGRAIEVRSGRLPTLPAVPGLWHGRSHGAATSPPRRRSALGSRARSRRPRQRYGVHPLAGPRTRAPLRRLSHHQRLDDVELPGELAAAGRQAAALRRASRLPAPGCPVGDGPERGRDILRRESRVRRPPVEGGPGARSFV